jgi:hypothetical protein
MGSPNPSWDAEKARIERLAWWGDLAGKQGVSADGKVWHLHPLALVSEFSSRKKCICNAEVKSTRYGTVYGPAHWATDKLRDSAQWEEILSFGEATQEEKIIINAMCENEGALSSVQGYDSEILTAGAMQKTINPAGAGELPAQVSRFRDKFPDDYVELFETQGWHLESEPSPAKMYYQDAGWSGGVALRGDMLKQRMRANCNENNFGQVVLCKPVSVMVCAIASPNYVRLQITDFVARLRSVLELTPTGYAFTVSSLFKSALGRATALDEYVNRPSHVPDSIKRALDTFYVNNPAVSKNITEWAGNHHIYESQLVDIYGHGRAGMTDPVARYLKIKGELNV